MARKDPIKQLVFTEKDLCRVCYSCVRSCPAKAIRIFAGQAEVIDERCIGCGNCTRVCSQGAKTFLSSVGEVIALLDSPGIKTAIIAPSFPAEFTECEDYTQLVGMIRALGFDQVIEVAFGADIVTAEYTRLFGNNSDLSYIAANCPAIVHYVRQYHPDLTDNLARIASPAVVTARVARQITGEETRIVFIGPCIAKKTESLELDEVLTFTELRRLFTIKKIRQDQVTPTPFDPPQGGRGAIFAISRGMIQSGELPDDAIRGNIVVAEGKSNYPEALEEFEKGLLHGQHLELLACDGCIMGPGNTSTDKPYSRRNNIRKYLHQKLESFDEEAWKAAMEKYGNIDISQTYKPNDQRLPMPTPEEVEKYLIRMGKYDPRDHLNCGACGYETCHEHAIAIIEGLAEGEMCLPYTIEQLHSSINELDISNSKLASAQQALKQSEKMATMGQLSAGIAHELNNPLGVVMMYSNILLDECDESDPVREDLRLIVEQAERCKRIVGGLLNFARKSQVKWDHVDAAELINSSMSAVVVPKNVKLSFPQPPQMIAFQVDTEQMMQVLTNLYKNAIEAMPDGGAININLSETKEGMVHIAVADTGSGIPKEHLEKVFEPFFTTKEIGKGTGLGLATTYGIIKMHKGKITVESNDDPAAGETGTTFHIEIPKERTS
jgi:iron only hydrogenase large subunit-like protein/nitrogen-specific signal transduction histidine kinase